MTNLAFESYISPSTQFPLQAGNFIFSKLIKAKPDKFSYQCDRAADDDDDVPFPKTGGQPVDFLKQRFLADSSPWLSHPDYQRVLFINSIIELLWPHLSPAIHKEALKQAKQPLDDVCKQVKILDSIRIDKLDLGTRPFRVDSFKVFEAGANELVLECPVFWGGDIQVRVTAVIKHPYGVTFKAIDVPIDVANIQFKALMRITIKPLVETLPCFGGVTLSLLEEPTVNWDLRIGDSPDIMSIPPLPLALKAAVKIIMGKMLVYPNEFTVPLMENFGLPPPPLGMLKVRVRSASGLKSSFWDKVDPFVVAEIRKNRNNKTQTIQNNSEPQWNEELDLLLDDPETQNLTLIVKDEDIVQSELVGMAIIKLKGSDCLKHPRVPVTIKLPLVKPNPKGMSVGVVAGVATVADKLAPVASGSQGLMEGVKNFKKSGGIMGRLKKKKNKKGVEGEGGGVGGGGGGSPGPSPSGSQDTGASTTASAGTSPAKVKEGKGEEEEVASAPVVQQKKKKKKNKKEHDETELIGDPAGTLLVDLIFYPFKGSTTPVTSIAPGTAGPGDDNKAAAPAGEATTEGAEGVSAAPPALKSVVSSIRRSLKADFNKGLNPNEVHGVLTVTLKKAMGLANACDTFATVKLYDPNRLPIPDIEQRTAVVPNEATPRYNFKTDFVNITAASSLTVSLFSSPGLMDHMTKIPFIGSKSKALGKVRIPLKDVVMEGAMSGVYPLTEAETGEVMLTLEWTKIDVEEEEETEGTES